MAYPEFTYTYAEEVVLGLSGECAQSCQYTLCRDNSSINSSDATYVHCTGLEGLKRHEPWVISMTSSNRSAAYVDAHGLGSPYGGLGPVVSCSRSAGWNLQA